MRREQEHAEHDADDDPRERFVSRDPVQPFLGAELLGDELLGAAYSSAVISPSVSPCSERNVSTIRSMISARLSPVWLRSGSTRLAADLVPLSLSFSRPMRSTSAMRSPSMSYAIVTWCSTAPLPSRFCAAPPILPFGLAMSLSGW